MNNSKSGIALAMIICQEQPEDSWLAAGQVQGVCLLYGVQPVSLDSHAS